MPDPCDNIFDAWLRSFDHPTETVIAKLSKLAEQYGPTEVAEAIAIAKKNRGAPQFTEAQRLSYVSGILRRWKDAVEDPEAAARQRHIPKLVAHWRSQPRGSHYLPVYVLDAWLKQLPPDEIFEAMDLAEGIYAELKKRIAAAVARKSG
jgi:hypothetical protein